MRAKQRLTGVISYNRSVRNLPWVAAAFLLVAACSKNIQTTEAVRDGILEYLKTRSDIDLKNMTVDVSSVSFRQGEADATATFRAAGIADPSGTMAIRYTLEEKDGKWVVKGKGATGAGDPHGAQQPAMPPGHPTTPGAKP
jgi:hypothetical protein